MALIRDNIWGIGNETETLPGADNREAHRKFLACRNALATIVMSIEIPLLYLIGADPENPVIVWTQRPFPKENMGQPTGTQKKTVCIAVMQKHVKRMTEIFEELSIIEVLFVIIRSIICHYCNKPGRNAGSLLSLRLENDELRTLCCFRE